MYHRGGVIFALLANVPVVAFVKRFRESND
jgi:hypothetical protein